MTLDRRTFVVGSLMVGGAAAAARATASDESARAGLGRDIRDYQRGASGDWTAAVQAAIDSGGPVWIPEGEYAVDSLTGSNLRMSGTGTLRKREGTKGAMLKLSGSNTIQDITIDYDWNTADQSLPVNRNYTVYQTGGSLRLRGVTFLRSFTDAVMNVGGSLFVDPACRFTEAAPHNDRRGGNERLTGYITCYADAGTSDQVIDIQGAYFEGPIKDPARMHLNPTGLFITNHPPSGARFKAVKCIGATFQYCGTNAGDGNVTGAIDTYGGAENVVIEGNTIRFFTYAGIKVQNSSKVNIVGNIITDGYTPAGASVNSQSFGIITAQKARHSSSRQNSVNVVSNIIQRVAYVGIQNSVDDVNILANHIDGVDFIAGLGTAIFNTGGGVNISRNFVRDVAGTAVATWGDGVCVEGNRLQAREMAGSAGVYFEGRRLTLRDNDVEGDSRTSTSGFRTDGPACEVTYDGNFVRGFDYAFDARARAGPVADLRIGSNFYASIAREREHFDGPVEVSIWGPAVIPDAGDADVKAKRGAVSTVIFNSPLTATRRVAAPAGATNAGSVVRVIRAGDASGRHPVVTPSGERLAPGFWSECIWDGDGWRASGFGKADRALKMAHVWGVGRA